MARYAAVMKTTHMPGKVISAHEYRKLALVELEPGKTVADVTMISERCVAVRKVVRILDRIHMGTTMRSYGRRAWLELVAEAEELNRGGTEG